MSKTVNVRKKHKMYPLYVGVSMLMLFASVFCLYVAAFINAMNGVEQIICMLISAVGVLFFLMCTMYLFFNLFSPAIGVSVSSRGVRDYTTAGKGAGFIPKESIVSLKLFGRDNKEFLGITVLPDYVDGLGINAAAKKEIKNNIDSGMPAVVIRQADINVPIYKLMKLMVSKFEADNAAPGATTQSSSTPTDKNAPIDTLAILQPLDELMLTAEDAAENGAAGDDVFTLDFEEEIAPVPFATPEESDPEFTVLTVEELPVRPRTIDEMLAALVPDKKNIFSPLTVDEEDGNDNTESK